MNRRVLALLLALVMALSLLTGCGAGSTENADTAGETGETAETADTQQAQDAADEQAGEDAAETEVPAIELTDEIRSDPVAYVTNGAIHTADTVMTVDGVDVSAGTFFYMLAYQYYQASSMYANYGMSLDLTQTTDDEGTTIAQYMVNLAKEDAQRHIILLNKAQELKLELDEDQQAQLKELMDYMDERIALFYISTMTDMEYANRASLMGSRINDYYYGENGIDAPTDETLADYADQHGCYTCRYILLRTDDLEEDDSEGKAAQQAKAQELYDQMKDLSGEALLEKFAELQAEFNADGNTEPFSFDENSSLVPGFREKIAELAPGELGMTEETDYGFFVVLRLAPDLEEVRSTYVTERYDAMMDQWVSESKAEATPALDELELMDCFQRMQAVQNAVMSEMSAEEEAAADAEEAVMEEEAEIDEAAGEESIVEGAAEGADAAGGESIVEGAAEEGAEAEAAQGN